jgi:hypothetical protein
MHGIQGFKVKIFTLETESSKRGENIVRLREIGFEDGIDFVVSASKIVK